MSLESTEELCLIALKIDTEIEGTLTCASKNDMGNLATFHFDDILLRKVENVWA